MNISSADSLFEFRYRNVCMFVRFMTSNRFSINFLCTPQLVWLCDVPFTFTYENEEKAINNNNSLKFSFDLFALVEVHYFHTSC